MRESCLPVVSTTSPASLTSTIPKNLCLSALATLKLQELQIIQHKMSDKLRLLGIIIAYMSGLAGTALIRKIQATVHRWSYKGPSDTPKTVIVVGGSFAGVQLVKRLADMLPSGWQAVLVEKNSHFNYSFNMPRFSVVSGYELSAFLPYDGIFGKTLPGIVKHVQGDVVEVSSGTKEIRLASGDVLPYDILVVSTGSAQRPPAKLLGAADRELACDELRELQQRIHCARRIAVVGGGAVGIELVTDIKTFAEDSDDKPEKAKDEKAKAESNTKDVTLVHSRQQLLNRFGPRLHKHVLEVLKKLDVNVVLGQRPTIVYKDSAPDAQVGGPGALHYADGRVEEYDCILLCTGQTPNSGLFKTHPGVVAASGEILVAPTLQVTSKDGLVPDVFAFGDVAATAGSKMARAAFFQADTVADNVMAIARDKKPVAVYKPTVIEPSLKLTLGKDDSVIYMDEEDGRSILLKQGGESTETAARRAWFFYGLPYNKDGA
ncbi:amid-like nadh oxidoreductase [Ophiostoma piceae UAMH 11346]|uniref:Amid-like nadh oxidoreductase n=1 Tax=Ophiostoma piceae (strain UAMH 11346) TaxID=1262450 RepID=S3CAA9_OPHP1|nr:amid-like nadh oxidoreductase [Ophiostoma piceae UAMH 11346]